MCCLTDLKHHVYTQYKFTYIQIYIQFLIYNYGICKHKQQNSQYTHKDDVIFSVSTA